MMAAVTIVLVIGASGISSGHDIKWPEAQAHSRDTPERNEPETSSPQTSFRKIQSGLEVDGRHGDFFGAPVPQARGAFPIDPHDAKNSVRRNHTYSMDFPDVGRVTLIGQTLGPYTVGLVELDGTRTLISPGDKFVGTIEGYPGLADLLFGEFGIYGEVHIADTKNGRLFRYELEPREDASSHTGFIQEVHMFHQPYSVTEPLYLVSDWAGLDGLGGISGGGIGVPEVTVNEWGPVAATEAKTNGDPMDCGNQDLLKIFNAYDATEEYQNAVGDWASRIAQAHEWHAKAIELWKSLCIQFEFLIRKVPNVVSNNVSCEAALDEYTAWLDAGNLDNYFAAYQLWTSYNLSGCQGIAWTDQVRNGAKASSVVKGNCCGIRTLGLLSGHEFGHIYGEGEPVAHPSDCRGRHWYGARDNCNIMFPSLHDDSGFWWTKGPEGTRAEVSCRWYRYTNPPCS